MIISSGSQNCKSMKTIFYEIEEDYLINYKSLWAD
jgi:hypothetical protein